jgi:methylmalonyl-CoA/ethylmalonyl-CoA epimerase
MLPFNIVSSFVKVNKPFNNKNSYETIAGFFVEISKNTYGHHSYYTAKGIRRMEVKKIDHIGIAVKSIEKALPFYVDTLKLELLGIEEVESEKVKVAFLKIGESKIELLEPTAPDSAVATFIEKRGEGIHHVALGVDDIQARIDELKTKGIRMIQDTPKTGAGGALVAFMHPKSTGGVLYELCEKTDAGVHHE